VKARYRVDEKVGKKWRMRWSSASGPEAVVIAQSAAETELSAFRVRENGRIIALWRNGKRVTR